MKLTEEQQQIVVHRAGHARVSAVAGSGKTTTMVARLGHLLKQGVEADQIMVLMFNRSARDSFERSMRESLSTLQVVLPEIRTFHSLGLRLVNSFTKRGVLPPYKLVTNEYIQERLARQVANEVYREAGEESAYLSGEEIEEFLTYIDQVKSTTAGPKEVFAGLCLDSRFDFFPQAYNLFEEVRKKQRIRFYSDLIYEPLLAMLADDALTAWVTDRVDHIIVDEYQDINETQQQLLRILAGKRAQVMVVGDVDQCIYEWRGAKPEYITTRFATDFQNPVFYTLSYTFRFGHSLSLAANHLIRNNKKRDQKLCVSHLQNPSTNLVSLEEKSGKPVVEVVRKWLGGGRLLAEAVVLVRLFGQSVVVELALLEAGLPYRLEGSSNVFECPEFLALTGYLKLGLGVLNDDVMSREKHLITMLSQPHLGVRKEELESLAQAIAAGMSDPAGALQVLRNWCDSSKPEFIRKRFVEAAENWQWLMQQGGTFQQENAGAILKKLVSRLKLYDFYHSFSARSATAENRVKTCQALIDFASKNNLTTGELLDRVAQYQRQKQEIEGDRLLITSIHRAKGLEWPLVILTGLDEGSFPFKKESDINDSAQLEDERRLFYVAITRAVEKLVCIHPTDARLKKCIAANSGKLPSEMVRASRFMFESNFGFSSKLGNIIEKKDGAIKTIETDDETVGRRYLKAIGMQGTPQIDGLIKQKKNAPAKLKEQPDSKENLTINDIGEGMRVFHPVFGRGTVVTIKNRKQGRIIVLFDDHGEMVLLTGFAKLESLP